MLGAIAALTQAGLLRAAGRGCVEFVHPLVSEAVDVETPAGEQERLHQDAARLLLRDGHPAREAAGHLLRTSDVGHPWAGAALRQAAAEALAGGASETAAVLLRRALGEPLACADRIETLFALATAEARQNLSGVDSFATALTLCDEPVRRATIELALGRTLGLAGQHSAAVRILERALSEPFEETHLRGEIEAELTGHCLHTSDRLSVGFAHLATVDVDRPARSTADRLRQTIAAFARIAAAAITPDDAARIALAAAEDPAVIRGAESSACRFFVVETLLFAEAPHQAVAVLDEMIDDAQLRGSVPDVALASAFRAQANLRIGEVVEAEADGRQALAALEGDALGYCRPYVLSFMIDVLVERNELEECERLLVDIAPESTLAGSLAVRPIARQSRAAARSAGPTQRGERGPARMASSDRSVASAQSREQHLALGSGGRPRQDRPPRAGRLLELVGAPPRSTRRGTPSHWSRTARRRHREWRRGGLRVLRESERSLPPDAFPLERAHAERPRPHTSASRAPHRGPRGSAGGTRPCLAMRSRAPLRPGQIRAPRHGSASTGCPSART